MDGIYHLWLEHENDSSRQAAEMCDALEDRGIEARHPVHVGGGAYVTKVRLSDRYYLWTSDHDGTGFLWEVFDHQDADNDGVGILGGVWPASDVQTAADNLARLIGAMGEVWND